MARKHKSSYGEIIQATHRLTRPIVALTIVALLAMVSVVALAQDDGTHTFNGSRSDSVDCTEGCDATGIQLDLGQKAKLNVNVNFWAKVRWDSSVVSIVSPGTGLTTPQADPDSQQAASDCAGEALSIGCTDLHRAWLFTGCQGLSNCSGGSRRLDVFAMSAGNSNVYINGVTIPVTVTDPDAPDPNLPTISITAQADSVSEAFSESCSSCFV